MNKYKTTLLVAAVILVLLPAAGYEYKKKSAKNKVQQDLQVEADKTESQKKNGRLEKSSFSIILPEGWDETGTSRSTTTAMIQHIKEVLVDPVAQENNFRSYYSVFGGVAEDQSTANQAKKIKKDLSDLIKGVVFSQEEVKKINGREAYYLEAKFSQQGADLRVLIVFVKGKDKEMWRLSFNSLEGQWAENKELFYQLADSFIVKS